MNGKESYEQIPIPAELPEVCRRAESRWRRRRRTRRIAVLAACAAFLAGLSAVPAALHFSRSAGGAASSAAGSSAAVSSQPLPADPAAGVEATYSFLPTYPGDSIRTQSAETEADPAIRDLILSYYGVPEDFLASTRYYYNYVDLNGDGTDEIFVDVMGPYTSGTGGDSALLLSRTGGTLRVLQALTLVNVPVIVSDATTDGWHDLILPYTGGGAKSAYIRLTHASGAYPNAADAETLASLDGVTGTSILYTDVTAPDAPQLTLAP